MESIKDWGKSAQSTSAPKLYILCHGKLWLENSIYIYVPKVGEIFLYVNVFTFKLLDFIFLWRLFKP
jgi:hypothetical protein